MRLDLSKEQIYHVIWGLECNIEILEKDIEKQNPKGSVEELVMEALAIKKGILFYLKDFLENK